MCTRTRTKTPSRTSAHLCVHVCVLMCPFPRQCVLSFVHANLYLRVHSTFQVCDLITLAKEASIPGILRSRPTISSFLLRLDARTHANTHTRSHTHTHINGHEHSQAHTYASIHPSIHTYAVVILRSTFSEEIKSTWNITCFKHVLKLLYKVAAICIIQRINVGICRDNYMLLLKYVTAYSVEE